MFRNLYGFVRAHPWQFAGAVLLAAATVLTGIGLMSTSGYLISRAAQRPMLVDLFMVTAAVRFFGISRAVVRYTERVVSHDFTFRMLADLRHILYRSLDSKTVAWLMGRRWGDMLARLVSDIETLQNSFLRIIIPAISAGIITLLTFIGLFYVRPALAFATLTFLLVSGIILPLLAIHLAKGAGGREVTLKSEMKEYLVDHLQGVRELHWMNRKQSSIDEMDKMQEKLNILQHKNAGISGFLEGMHNLSAFLGMFTVLILSVPLVSSGEIKGVMLAMLTLGVLSSFEAVQNLGNAFQHLGSYNKAAHRIFSVTNNDQTAQEPDEMQVIPQETGIVFNNVNFSYKSEQITLDKISFTVAHNSRTAIVGPTGSGKSTLINLLLKLWEQQSGDIFINRTNIRDIHSDQLRSIISVVSQEPYIFNRSLRENLLIAKPDATDEQIIQALQHVNLISFTNNLDMPLGNQGMRLSGGERKLLELARAWLKNAPVWILDEPTANLDIQTERQILDVVHKAANKRTLIIITHRLIDMQSMDQIVVMDKGRIVENGTHQKLMESEGIYHRMIKHQGAYQDFNS